MDAGAACVIFDEHGRVLLIKENYGRRRWGLPGGARERGEAPQDTAIRETREETGVDVEIDHLVGIYRLESGFVAHAFAARIVSGVPAVPATGEIAAVVWEDPHRLPKPRSSILHYAVQDAVQGFRGVVREHLPRIG